MIYRAVPLIRPPKESSAVYSADRERFDGETIILLLFSKILPQPLRNSSMQTLGFPLQFNNVWYCWKVGVIGYIVVQLRIWYSEC